MSPELPKNPNTQALKLLFFSGAEMVRMLLWPVSGYGELVFYLLHGDTSVIYTGSCALSVQYRAESVMQSKSQQRSSATFFWIAACTMIFWFSTLKTPMPRNHLGSLHIYMHTSDTRLTPHFHQMV